MNILIISSVVDFQEDLQSKLASLVEEATLWGVPLSQMRAQAEFGDLAVVDIDSDVGSLELRLDECFSAFGDKPILFVSQMRSSTLVDLLDVVTKRGGYLLPRFLDRSDFHKLISTIASNHGLIPAGQARVQRKPLYSQLISPIQNDVLNLALHGLPCARIAATLNQSEDVIRSILRVAFLRLEGTSHRLLALKAIQTSVNVRTQLEDFRHTPFFIDLDQA